MPRETVNAICKTFPGAELSYPFGGGEDVWKVGGKMFAAMDSVTRGVSVKTDSVETAQMLIEAGAGVKARYFHGSWINISWDMEEPDCVPASPRLTVSSALRCRKNCNCRWLLLNDGFRVAAQPESA